MIKTTTLRIPSETLIQLKALAIRQEKSQNDIILDLINKGLKATGKSNKPRIKQMPFTDPDKKGNLENIIGTAKVENADNLDVNELIDSIHTKGVKFE